MRTSAGGPSIHWKNTPAAEHQHAGDLARDIAGLRKLDEAGDLGGVHTFGSPAAIDEGLEHDRIGFQIMAACKARFVEHG
nr:hypothetical protein [Erythrobacter sp.]